MRVYDYMDDFEFDPEGDEELPQIFFIDLYPWEEEQEEVILHDENGDAFTWTPIWSPFEEQQETAYDFGWEVIPAPENNWNVVPAPTDNASSTQEASVP